MSDLSLPDFSLSDNDSGRPKYERLKEYFVAEMAQGRLRPGMALPSEQRLAESLHVARSTVRQAMSLLERDGFVSRIHGKGTFIHEEAHRRLKRGSSLFALIVPETQVGFYPALLRSFEQSASESHHQVIVCNSNNEIDKQGNTILQLIDRRVAGVAMVPTTSPPTPAFHVRQLQQAGIPVVCCSRRVDEIAAPLLAIPFEEVGRLAGRRLIAAGHRRIAYFSTYPALASRGYENGLREALRTAGVDSNGLQVFHGSSPQPGAAVHEEEVAAALDRMYGDECRPTAIFASFDSLAELIYVLLIRRGLRVPEDVSLIGFGGSQRQGALLRRLTSVTVDEVRMGRRAVDLLERMSRLEIPLNSDDVLELPLGLNKGETLAACGRLKDSAIAASPAQNGKEGGSV